MPNVVLRPNLIDVFPASNKFPCKVWFINLNGSERLEEKFDNIKKLKMFKSQTNNEVKEGEGDRNEVYSQEFDDNEFSFDDEFKEDSIPQEVNEFDES